MHVQALRAETDVAFNNLNNHSKGLWFAETSNTWQQVSKNRHAYIVQFLIILDQPRWLP